jgi:hypothetical protein
MTDAEVAAAFEQAIADHAKDLHVPASIDPQALLRAIAMKESTRLARWQAPRHEQSYCYGGSNHMKNDPGQKMIDWKWGCAAHSSWSPWQIMFRTAVELGFDPTRDPADLKDPFVAVDYVVLYLNHRLFDTTLAPTLANAFDAWNSGTARDRNVPEDYIKEASALYEIVIANGGEGWTT